MPVQPKPDVLRNAQRVKQAEMLKHHADAKGAGLARAVRTQQLAIDTQATSVWLGRAVNNLHQRRFTGAVFAQHSVDFSGLNQQGNVTVCHHARVSFGDARQLQARHTGHG